LCDINNYLYTQVNQPLLQHIADPAIIVIDTVATVVVVVADVVVDKVVFCKVFIKT